MTHDRTACDFCRSEAVMRQVTDLLEIGDNGIPVFNVPLFDDAIAEVYNAAEHAASLLQCRAAYDEDHGIEHDDTR